MSIIISMIKELVQKVLAIGIVGLGITLLASEVKLAALKKVSQGSVKLSGFTQEMTKMRAEFK